MTTRTLRFAALALLSLPLLGACAGTAAVYVQPDDPALAVCQSSAVQGISDLVQAVDNANNTDPDAPWTGDAGQALVPAQVTGLEHATGTYRQYAVQVAAHPALASALQNEAQEFVTAAASPTRLTTNTVARAADTFSGEITGTCSALQVGTAPKAVRPGPGIWDWHLAGFALAGYLLTALAASYVIAIGQRGYPRRDRFTPAKISILSLVWWMFIFAAIARIYGRAIATATLTPDERKDDRIAAQEEKIRRLQGELGVSQDSDS
jgi:hypothetical protein